MSNVRSIQTPFVGSGPEVRPRQRLFTPLLLILFVLAGTAFLCYLVDRNLDCGWPSNVIRNWEQYGVLKLKGKLVVNPGGYQALNQPDVYPGHQPTSLYSVLIVKRMFAWTGAGLLPFHLVLNLAILVSLWFLFGRNRVACLVAGATVLCPGYIRWPMVLDPNALAVLYGFPFAVILFHLLRGPCNTIPSVAGLFLLIFAYTALNWTTALVHALLLSYFLVVRKMPWRKLMLYAILACTSTLVVAGISVYQKIGGGNGKGMPFWEFFQAYGWGSGGYGIGMTFTKAVLRLGFVNTVALLPLLIPCGWIWISVGREAARTKWLALLPLGLSIAEVFTMRNYFSHHPWMAAPVLLMGTILSTHAVITARDPAPAETATTEPVGWRRSLPTLYLLASFVYGAVVLAVYQAQAEKGLALTSFVRAHTERSDTIVVVRSLDPMLASEAKRMEEQLDRRVLVRDDLASLSTADQRAFVLSAQATGWPVLAETEAQRLGSSPLMKHALDWFNESIARRNPGDRIEYADVYYLYRWETTGSPQGASSHKAAAEEGAIP